MSKAPILAEAPTLSRSLGTAGILFLTLSVTTPASSVFVIVPGMLHVAGTGALAALLIACAVCAATAFIYAELSSAWPEAGGEYVMAAHTLGPLAGFVMLGVNVFNNLLFPPVAALGLSAVAAVLIPGLPAVPLAIAALAAATLLGVLNIRLNARVTAVFLAAEVAALATVVALGLLHPARGFGAVLLHPAASHGAASIGVAASIAIFALNGYGAAVYFGEEMHEAPARIARAILIALAATLAFEVLPVAAALLGAPDLPHFLAADDPFGDVVATLGGAAVHRWVALGVVAAILNAIVACTLATARFFYASGRDGSWGRPVDRWLAAISPRFASPANATLMSGGVGIALCFVPLHLLLVISGSGLLAIYAGMTWAAVAGRRRGSSAHARYRMPLYPLAPAVAGGALAYVTWLNWLDPGDGRAGLYSTLAQIAGSVLYYLAFLRRRAWTASTR